MRMRNTVIHALSGCKIIFSITKQRARFAKKKKVIELKICVLIFSIIFSEKFLILRRTEWGIKNVCWSSYKVSIILVIF